MRVLMSLAGLLLVLLLVSKLAGTQLQALGPGAGAPAATGDTVQAPAKPSNAASAAAARVMQALEQGAAQRAEDAASR